MEMPLGGTRLPSAKYGARVTLERGERFFIPCEGGPSMSRLTTCPPPFEVEESEGMYVLVDDGPIEQWYYVFEPRS